MYGRTKASLYISTVCGPGKSIFCLTEGPSTLQGDSRVLLTPAARDSVPLLPSMDTQTHMHTLMLMHTCEYAHAEGHIYIGRFISDVIIRAGFHD